MTAGIAWIGVDPGQTTGLACRSGELLIGHVVIAGVVVDPARAAGNRVLVGAPLITGVLDAISNLVSKAEREFCHSVRVAVEAVNAPTGFSRGKRAPIDPANLLAAAVVLGAVLAEWPDATIVPPGGNGSGTLSTYPAELVTTGERRLGLDRPAGQSTAVRHARSAWDIAGLGPRRAAALAAGAGQGQLC